MDVTFALSPSCFSFLLFKSRSLINTCVHTITMDFISCGHLHPWVPPSSFTWIGPSYLVTHLDERISPTRFHQLFKTKLGLSPLSLTWRAKPTSKPYLGQGQQPYLPCNNLWGAIKALWCKGGDIQHRSTPIDVARRPSFLHHLPWWPISTPLPLHTIKGAVVLGGEVPPFIFKHSKLLQAL